MGHFSEYEDDTMSLPPGQGLQEMLSRIRDQRANYEQARDRFRALPTERRRLVGERVSMTLAHLMKNSRDPEHREDCEAFLEFVRAVCS